MKRGRGRELASLLRQLADYIEDRSDADLISLFEHVAKPSGTNRKKAMAPPKSAKGQEYLEGISADLKWLPSRESGETLLRRRGLTRDDLEALARYLQLPVQRDDNIDKLRAKIIENVIGSRLRSDAIRR